MPILNCFAFLTSEHVVSTPGQAISAFRAGHTIYFDPPKTTQKEWICPLSKRLPGASFSVPSGKRFSGVYGEIEVFLSTGVHETPFHFDFQESITIQIAGCKRWLLTPSNFRNPTHNASPFIYDRELLYDQLKAHGPGFDLPAAENLAMAAKGVTLRFA